MAAMATSVTAVNCGSAVFSNIFEMILPAKVRRFQYTRHAVPKVPTRAKIRRKWLAQPDRICIATASSDRIPSQSPGQLCYLPYHSWRRVREGLTGGFLRIYGVMAGFLSPTCFHLSIVCRSEISLLKMREIIERRQNGTVGLDDASEAQGWIQRVAPASPAERQNAACK